MQNEAKHDDVAGEGHGFVDVFDLEGHRVRRFASRGKLNSPWGVALAPATFGKFANDILVGNFGNGRITAFDPVTGKALGQLQDKKGVVLSINGLWSVTRGGAAESTPDQVFFTAGINDERDGLFGRLVPAR